MSGFLTPPTFAPPVYSIPLGTPGQVLTIVGGVPKFAAASGGGGGTLTGRIAFASPAGNSNNVTPAVVPPATWITTGRLVVMLASGDATWTGLLAGTDGQLMLITNADAANQLTLLSQNAGSLAANRFLYSGGGLILSAGESALMLYDATLAQWLLT